MSVLLRRAMLRAQGRVDDLRSVRRARTDIGHLMSIHGWTDAHQLRYLQALVQRVPDGGAIVEIGVWQGRSAIAMALACRGTNKKVYAVDPWQDYTQEGKSVASQLHGWGLSSFQEVYGKFLENIRRFAVEPYVIPLRASSSEVSSTWTYGPVHLIFIDGSHNYESVASDLLTWVPHLDRHGIICGDDWNWPGVRKAVAEFIFQHPDWNLQLPLPVTWSIDPFSAPSTEW